ncbi:hypothetical protein HYW73_02310 [Candidatus Nomurabacteria bacterium]|nr:hypothetical protein [Candidatus Nomurabacteria bacterium]
MKTETRSGSTVSIDAESVVTISGGSVDDAITVGMDIDGSVKVNFQIKSSQKLNIGTDNIIKISL